MKRVYWVHRRGNIVLGEVLLAEGRGTDEELLQEAKDEAERAGLDISHGTLEIYEEEEIKMVKVNNRMIDFDAAVNLMDDEIREELHQELAPCTHQEFIDAYAKRHRERFGEEFTVN